MSHIRGRHPFRHPIWRQTWLDPTAHFFRNAPPPFPGAPSVLDVGGGRRDRSAARRVITERHARWFSLDLLPEAQPHVRGDAQQLPFRSGSIGGIHCSALLEHLPEPWRLIREAHRILQPGGEFAGYAPFLYPYHRGADERYRDYFRFTTDGMASLLRRFDLVILHPFETYAGTLLRFMAGFTPLEKPLLALLRRPAEMILDEILPRVCRGPSATLRNLAWSTTGMSFRAWKAPVPAEVSARLP